MNPTTHWPDKTLPVDIYCAPGVLTGLEMEAADGLLAVPRIGLGVGGLLLGRRVNRSLEILKTVAIPCSHALGPAFALTPEEMAAALDLPARQSEPESEKGAEDDAEDNADHDCNLVGWYFSKPNGPQAMTENGRALFDALCPEPWQVALLIWPCLGKTTTAAFGFRESGDRFLLGAPRELAWQDLGAFQVARPEPTRPEAAAAVAAAAPAEPKASEPAVPEPKPPGQPPVAQIAAPVPAAVDQPEDTIRETPHPEAQAGVPAELESPVVTVPMPQGGMLFGAPEPARKVRKKRRWILRLLDVVVVLALLAAVAFFTRNDWLPHPRVALLGTSDRMARVSILWDSEVLSEQDRVMLVIDDGAGPVHTIYLDRAGVRKGWYEYDCRQGTVNATLVAGEMSDSVTLTARAESYSAESGISK